MIRRWWMGYTPWRIRVKPHERKDHPLGIRVWSFTMDREFPSGSITEECLTPWEATDMIDAYRKESR